MMGPFIFYLLAMLSLPTEGPIVIYDFDSKKSLDRWQVVDDVVMGGRSDGNLTLTKGGNGLFYGDVSLENYGGFSSIRYEVEAEAKNIASSEKCKIRLKGDGKAYQFRIKKDRYDRYSYITTFQTSSEWEVIEISLADMYPSFRGMQLDLPNYAANTIEEICFLISNKKNESFQLEIDWIHLSD